MKSEETKRTLDECLNYSKCSELPNVLDETTRCWRYAIALVQRTSLGEDYVIVKNHRGIPTPIMSFAKLSFQIKEVKEIYPYSLYTEDLLPKMKDLSSVVKYLSNFYEKYEYMTPDGELDKVKIKGLLVENCIDLLKQEQVINPNFIAKPIKVKTVKKEEVETKKELKNETKEDKPEPKRKAGRPSKQAKDAK